MRPRRRVLWSTHKGERSDVSEREPYERENETDVEGHLLELDRNDESTTGHKPEKLREESEDDEPDVEAHGGWRSL
jgi:hypothetical protein